MAQDIQQAPDRDAFTREISAAQRPCVLRGACNDWRLVEAAGQGPGTVLEYLAAQATETPVHTVVAQPDAAGRFGYREDFTQLNHEARQTPLRSVLPHLAAQQAGNAHAIAVQAAPVREVLRDWDAQNAMHLLPGDVPPTLWISNRARVAPHCDIHDNVAVVAAGRRCFTLFPPEQIHNLYLGPLLNAPGGVPVTAVDLWNPDLQRYPRFSAALNSALYAELNPGDALYIPALWWHAVESAAAINVLVNFWWGGVSAAGLSPYEALRHAMLAVAQLPAEKRRRWKTFFDHLAFRLEAEPGEHLPEDLSDLITAPSDAQLAELLQQLAASLENRS